MLGLELTPVGWGFREAGLGFDGDLRAVIDGSPLGEHVHTEG